MVTLDAQPVIYSITVRKLVDTDEFEWTVTYRGTAAGVPVYAPVTTVATYGNTWTNIASTVGSGAVTSFAAMGYELP